jgi:outer membrane autotransporter protein
MKRHFIAAVSIAALSVASRAKAPICLGRTRTNFAIAAITLFALAFTPATSLRAQSVLGTAASFGVLAGSAVTNTGGTVINGNVGVSPGTSITGFFPPGIVNPPGVIHNNDAVAAQAQIDLTNAFNNLGSKPPTADLTGKNLGGLVLTPGVYTFSSAAQLTGTLTLNGLGNPNAVFIFKMGSTLTTASGSSVVLINGAQGGNVFFKVGSSATLGTGTLFTGDILALTSIALNTGANINCGAALARNGAVTLDTNKISICNLAAATVGSVIGSSATTNQRAIANALDTFVANGGTLPPAFQNLLGFLSPSELAAAITQLSGEAGTSVAPAGIQAMNSFLSLVLNPFDEDRNPEKVPVKPPYYVKAPYYKAPLGAAPDPRRWDIWAAGYGGQDKVSGDLAAGTHDRSAHSFGVAAGVDYRVSPDTRVGFALAGGGTNFGVADNLGGGRSDIFQAAIYSRTYFDAAYVEAALAYAWNGVSTDRFVTLAGTDHLTAAFDAHDVAGRIEGGYRFAVPNVLGVPGHEWFTPYAALQAQAFYTPAYSESAASGSPDFALSYAAQTTTTIRTELGARTEWTMPVDNGATLSLRTRTAWAHDHWSSSSVTAMFQSLPGSSFFTVNGAVPVSDSLLALAGAEIRFSNGFAVAGWFDSELAQRSQTYSGTARLRYTW